MTRKRLIFGGMFVFLTGALISSAFEWLQPITAIKIKNASTKVIAAVDISYGGIDDNYGHINGSIAPGEIVIFKWITESESGYQLWITFDDGAQLTGGFGYAERGSYVEESIFSDRIESSSPDLLTFGILHNSPTDTTRNSGLPEKL